MDKEVIQRRLIMIELNLIKDPVKEIIESPDYNNRQKIIEVINLINSLQPRIYQRLQNFENYLLKNSNNHQ